MPAPSTWASRSLLTGLAGAALLVPIEAASLAPLEGDILWVSATLLFGLGAAVSVLLLAEERLVVVLRGQSDRPLLVAMIRSAAALLAFIPVTAHLFDGAFASSLPGAAAAPYMLPVLGYLGVVVVVCLGSRLLEVGTATAPLASLHRRRRVAGVSLVLLAGALEFVNRSLFRSEYPDIHTFLLMAACVCLGMALRLLILRPERGPGRRARIVLTVLTLAASANFALCLSAGLQSSESRLAVATRGNHTRMLVRLVRGLSDRDGDGFAAVLGGADCDDNDPAIHPDALEIVGNGVDEDCDDYIASEDLTVALEEAEEAREEEVGLWIESEEVRAVRARLGRAPILLLSVDALRGDVLQDTQKNRGDFPNLFELLDASTNFSYAFSPAAGTDLSVSSMLTGRIDPFSTVDSTLAEALAERGYHGYAVIPSEVLRYVGKTLITRGLADYRRLVNDLHERDVGSYTTSHRTTQRGLEFLDGHLEGESRDAPFFLWLHYFDVHEHDEVESHDRHLRALTGDQPLPPGKEPKYRAMVSMVDRAVGDVIAALRERDLWETTIIVFASDHGESLGEDPRLPDNHGRVLYNPLTHIPLSIRLPGVPPRRSDAPVTLVDVMPTLLSLAEAPLPDGLDGDILLPHILPGAPESLRDAVRPLILNESDQHGVVLWPHKLLVRGDENITELFDLRSDFDERYNLAASAPDTVGELTQIYRAAPPVNLDRTSKGRRLRERAAARPERP